MYGTIKINIESNTLTSATVTEHENINFVKNGIMQMCFPVSDEDNFNAIYKVGLTIPELTNYSRKEEAKRSYLQPVIAQG